MCALIENCIIRTYQQDDEEEIVDLLKLVFRDWPHLDVDSSSIEYWRWKYLKNPLKKIFITLCEIDNRIIGCIHMIPLKVKIGDDVSLCTTGVDLAVHPDSRGMGLSTSMGEHRKNMLTKGKVKVCYHFTGNPILVKSRLKRENRFPHELVNLVHIKDITKQLKAIPVKNTLYTKLGFKLIKNLNSMRNLLRASKSSSNIDSIEEVEAFDDKIDEFWEEISPHYDFIVERRKDYLNWKYCDPQVDDFVVKKYEENGRIIGYMVLRINRYQKDYPIGYVVDFLTLPDRLDVADMMVKGAMNYFDSNDINIINYQIVKDHPYEKIFKRNGFLDSKIEFYLFYLFFGGEDILEKIKTSQGGSIFLSWGDFDVLPVRMPPYER